MPPGLGMPVHVVHIASIALFEPVVEMLETVGGASESDAGQFEPQGVRLLFDPVFEGEHGAYFTPSAGTAETIGTLHGQSNVIRARWLTAKAARIMYTCVLGHNCSIGFTSSAAGPGDTTVCRLHKENRGMQKVVVMVIAGLTIGGFVGARTLMGAKEAKEKKSKYSIKEVMKLAHKNKLMEKVAGGDASMSEKEKLLGLYIALSEGKPPRGDGKDWKMRCDAIVKAARAVVKGEDGAEARLKKTVNCKGCHEKHKGEDED
jgi:hypothetical protein